MAAVFSSLTAVLVTLIIVFDGCDDSACACCLITLRSEVSWLASTEYSDVASPFRLVSAVSIAVRSAET